MERVNLRWPNWLGVVVTDLDVQRRFYRDVLGFRELAAGELTLKLAAEALERLGTLARAS